MNRLNYYYIYLLLEKLSLFVKFILTMDKNIINKYSFIELRLNNVFSAESFASLMLKHVSTQIDEDRNILFPCDCNCSKLVVCLSDKSNNNEIDFEYFAGDVTRYPFDVIMGFYSRLFEVNTIFILIIPVNKPCVELL